jgi:hypothetical protein
MSIFAGLRANLTLVARRLVRDEGIYRLLRTAFTLVAIVVIAIAAFLQGTHWLNLAPSEPGWWGSAVGPYRAVRRLGEESVGADRFPLRARPHQVFRRA